MQFSKVFLVKLAILVQEAIHQTKVASLMKEINHTQVPNLSDVKVGSLQKKVVPC